MESLRDATVVITGASSGIGLATARAFAACGANVVLAARRRELLDRAARDCEALGVRALAVPTDVTDPDRVRDLADTAVSAFGGIDVWVNNAGTSMWGRFEDIPLESQSRLVELNLLGAINGCHAALPHFLERGGRGVIINVSSIFGRAPMPFAASYTASKAGLAGFTEALRAELAPRSEIEVCGVYPAYVDTPTYLNSANYTGRALRPVPPVVPPERVADRIVGLALRPRRSVRVGSLNALAVPHAIAPDAAGRLVARLGRRFLFRSGPRAPDTDGGLFGTVAGRAEARGDWGIPERGMPERRRARRTAAVATVLAAGVYGYLLSRQARDARGASGGDRTR
jgi:NAD(P)-dependent dehydrogenase (short-subunit alcohol dehydrogenase family)